jgi:hypothetical protein
MSAITGGTAGGRTYIALQRMAKDTRRNAQELIQLYVLEGLLARLAESPLREKLVLKGSRKAQAHTMQSALTSADYPTRS